MFPEKKDDIPDYCAGILNMFIGIGQATGPVYGAYMVHNFNFRITQDVVCVAVLIFGILYLFLGDGFTAFKSVDKQ